MRPVLFTLICYLTITSLTSDAQVPFAIWDLENDLNRSTTETSMQIGITGVGTPSLTTSSLTAAHGTGNGLAYSGSVAGSALGYYNWTTNTSSAATNPSVTIGALNASGFSNITISVDVIGIGTKAPKNLDLWYSTNGTSYTRIVPTSNSVGTSWSTLKFTLPVAGPNTLHLRFIGYNAGAGSSATDGVMKLDNIVLSTATITAAKTLLKVSDHGTALSSGGSYLPEYVDLSMTGNNSNVTIPANSNMIFSGTVSIGNSDLIINDNTLTLHTSNTPIIRGNGKLNIGANGSLAFGMAGKTAGNSFQLPSALFNTTSFKNFTVNKDNTITLNNQGLTLSGDLSITKGTLELNGLTITVAGHLNGTGSITSTVVNSLITMTGTTNNIGVASVPNLRLNNASGIYTLTGDLNISGTLTLTAGTLFVNSRSLIFHTGNTPIVVTSGKIQLSSASTIQFGKTGSMGGTAFVIPGNVFTTPVTVKNFIMNRTNALTLNAQNIDLYGSLTITSGNLILPANYLFTLKSTSISNTALVDKVGGSITYGTGAAFLVERYIPNDLPTSKRAFRDLSPSVNSSTTIFQNWQENGNNSTIYGTHITGAIGSWPGGVAPTTGFDYTTNGNKSLRLYEISATTGAGSWLNPSSTNQPADQLIAYKGYRLYLRGNRMTDLYEGGSPTLLTSPIILRSKGTLITGDVTITETGTNANGSLDSRIRINKGAQRFTMVGNPYVAPIDWHSLYDNNSSLIGTSYSFLDPNINGGAYVTYNRFTGSNNINSDMNQFIQPGQSFLIQNKNVAGPFSFKITEADKNINTADLSDIFKTKGTKGQLKETGTHNKLAFILTTTSTGSTIVTDGATMVFNNAYSSAVQTEDAEKLTNPAENIGIKALNTILGVDGRPEPKTTDTLTLHIWQMQVNVPYQLKVNTTLFTSNGLQPYIIDRYKNTEHAILSSGETTINFTVTNDAASKDDRFLLIFRQGTVLPARFIEMNALAEEKRIRVSWKAQQSELTHYILMRSKDGKNFINIDSVKVDTQEIATYTLFDQINGPDLYYQVYAVSKDGSIDRSKIIHLSTTERTDIVRLFSNPVQDRIIRIQVPGNIRQRYSLSLYDVQGRIIASAERSPLGSFINWSVSNSIAKGTYILKVVSKDHTRTFNLIIDPSVR